MAITSPAAVISDAGIAAPTYAEVLEYFTTKYKAIYGEDVYLGPDSKDGQFIAIIALAMHDSNSTQVKLYNSFSPATAQGRALSNNVKINNMTRHEATRSTVDVKLIGVAGSEIKAGRVAAVNSNIEWALPESVVIPLSGEILVQATCTTKGANFAPKSTITVIRNPQRGWQSVTNPSDGVPGSSDETDAALRARQAISTMTTAYTVLDAIVADLRQLNNVTRVKAYENDTAQVDANTLPPHSISLIVEGGDPQEIATAIGRKKSDGCGTYGSTTENFTNSSGVTIPIHFYRPTNVRIKVVVRVKARAGWLSSTIEEMQKAISAKVQGSELGSLLLYTKLYGVALMPNTAVEDTFELLSITMAKEGETQAATNIQLAFNEAAICVVADVDVRVTTT